MCLLLFRIAIANAGRAQLLHRHLSWTSTSQWQLDQRCVCMIFYVWNYIFRWIDRLYCHAADGHAVSVWSLLYLNMIYRWISWRRVVAKCARATWRWTIATAAGRLPKTSSLHLNCKRKYIHCKWWSLVFYRATPTLSYAHNFCLFKGRMVCQWSRTATSRTLLWRSKWPMSMEMMHTKPPWSPPFHVPLPTMLTVL